MTLLYADVLYKGGLMEQKNIKVILELKDNLSENEKELALSYIEKWKTKFKIEKVDEKTYCKKGDNKKYSDDAGDVGFFYAMLGQKKELFKQLEAIKTETGEVDVTV